MERSIEITKRGDRNVVGSKQLLVSLGISTRFDIWMQRFINDFALVEGFDFERLYKNVQMPNGGQKRSLDDYVITLDVAKEICMLQRNKTGRSVRRYFIECERKMQDVQVAPPTPQLSRKELALMIVEAEEEIERLSEQNRMLEPKAAYFDNVLSSDSSFPVTIIAKELGMSAIALNRKLQELGVIFNVAGTWVLKRNFQNDGYTTIKTHQYRTDEGIVKTAHSLHWTEKGRAFVHRVVKNGLPQKTIGG